jgi:hypothetical protein
MDIKGEHRPIQKVFCNDFVLKVPHYQRPYAWKLENAQELLADLLAFMGEGNGKVDELPPYFLGSIVLVKDDTRADADVIDGQQRLTTLTMLLAVLRATTEKPFREGLTEFLYQAGNPVTGAPDQYRLRLRPRDAEFFREFVQAPGGLVRLSALTRELPDAQQRIRENVLLFQRELGALPVERRQRLASYLVQRCYLVVVSTPDADSAYRIFSVLNDRGLDLSHADILKAEIVGAIEGDEMQKAYATKWEEAEEAIGRDAFKDLFGHLRMTYRRAKLESTVLAEFRRFVVEKVPDTRALVDDVIVAGAWAYDQIRRCSWDGEADASSQRRIEAMLAWLNRMDNIDWVPPAIRVMQNTADAAKVLQLLVALERLAAFLLVRRANVNERIHRYSAVLDAIDKGVAGDVSSPLQLSADEQRQFLAALDGDVYLEPKIRVYVLLRLDQALGDASAKYDVDTLTVEHVLPQAPRQGSRWFNDFPTDGDRRWTHRLGNLVLLPRRKNSEASNWDFDEKKKRYFTSKRGVSTFALTSQVLKENAWTPAVVARRQTETLDTLKTCWSLTA